MDSDTYQVELVAPDAPLEPPQPAHLPDGSVHTATLERTTGSSWSSTQRWLEDNGFHMRQLIAVPGIWLFTAPDGRPWIVVDYLTGSAWTAEDERPNRNVPAVALRGLQLNHEAGRCTRDEPGAFEAARDRHVRPLTDPVPADLAPYFIPPPRPRGR